MKPTVQLMRGIVGSGKSHHLTHDIRKAKIFSTDLFWGPGYDFDPRRIGEAHAWCYKQYLNCLDYCCGSHSGFHDKPELIIIDNTNLHAWECAPYMLAAAAYGLQAEVLTLVCDPAKAAARNVHKVPASVVFAMHQTLLTERLPPFWKNTVLHV